MEKTKTIRGNKAHASKIRMYFESLSEYKSNPCNELVGLLFMLLSITGLGNFGIVGQLMKKFSIFLFYKSIWRN